MSFFSLKLIITKLIKLKNLHDYLRKKRCFFQNIQILIHAISMPSVKWFNQANRTWNLSKYHLLLKYINLFYISFLQPVDIFWSQLMTHKYCCLGSAIVTLQTLLATEERTLTMSIPSGIIKKSLSE